jgi:uncharacterized Fe-S cluster protein YjdI/CDGSH-type Zn-finger protein
MKKIQSYSTDEITVTFDPNLCIHSAVCLASLPAVFDVRRRKWVHLEGATAADVAATIDRCPSGALRYVLAGQTESTGAEPDGEGETTIQASTDGPLLIEGVFRVLDENGREIANAGRAAFCRCGGTATQPFCDGSHRRVGFKSKAGPAA